MTHREIDRRIESEIMGHDLKAMKPEQVSHYSVDMNQAMRVVEKLRADGSDVMIDSHKGTGKWCVVFLNGYHGKIEMHKSLPRAICLAALKKS